MFLYNRSISFLFWQQYFKIIGFLYYLFFKKIKFYIGLQLIYNMLVSGVQQSDEVFYTHTYTHEKEMAVHTSILAWRIPWASQVVAMVKNPPASVGEVRDDGLMPGSRRSPEKGNGNPLVIAAWKIPRTGKPGRL